MSHRQNNDKRPDLKSYIFLLLLTKRAAAAKAIGHNNVLQNVHIKIHRLDYNVAPGFQRALDKPPESFGKS